MIYGTKYSLTFNDVFNRKWRLDLNKQSYTGSIYSVIGGESPVILTDPNEGEDKFNPVKGTEMSISLLVYKNNLTEFNSDFAYTTDRQWQASLYREFGESDLYKGQCVIDTFQLANTSADPTGSIDFSGQGLIVNAPECFVEFTPQITDATLRLTAVPDTAGVNFPAKIDIATITVETTDSYSDIETKLLNANSNLTSVTPTYEQIKLKYRQTTYDENLDSEWTIKIDYSPSINYINGYYFDGSTKRSWIEVNLVVADEDGNNILINTLGRRYFQNGETTEDIVEELKNKIDGTAFDPGSIYFPDDDTYEGFSIKATRSGTTLNMTLNGLRDIGNIPIREHTEYSERPNDTFIEINWLGYYGTTINDFSGGTEGGDNFKIEVFNGSVGYTLAETTGDASDTAATVIQRLVDIANNTSVSFNTKVDDTSNNTLILTTDETDWQYRFTTNGDSTLSPTSFTDMVGGSDDKLKWNGWIIPGMYKDELTPGYTQIELKAIDAMGDLKSYELEINQKRPFEKRNLMDILSSTLENTGLNFRIYESFDLWEENMDTSISPLKQTYQDASRLNGVNSYEILKELARITKSQILQRNGHWELQPIDKQHTSFTYRVFNQFGNKVGTIGKTFNIQKVGGVGSDNVFLNQDQSFEYADIFRYIQFKQNYGFVEQLLQFPAFNSIDANLKDNNYNLQYPWQFRFDGSIQTGWLNKVYRDGEYIALVNDIGQDNKHYLSQKFIVGDIPLGDTREKQFEFSIRYKQSKTEVTLSEEFKVQLIITDGTNTAYLQQTDARDKMTTSQSFIVLPCRERYGDSTKTIKFDYPTDILSGNIADAEIRLYQPDDRRVKIRDIKININTIAPSGIRKRTYYDELVDELSYEPYKKNISLGDVPQTVISKQVYKNALYWKDSDGNFQLTELWDSSDPKSLIDHIRFLYLREYSKSDTASLDRKGPPAVLTAIIRGKMELRDVIKDTTNDNKLFTLIGGEWNIKQCIISGEWQQINIDDAGLTRIDETKGYEEESSGSNSYTTISDGEEDTDVDLSNYLTQSEIISLLGGFDTSFTGSDLTNYQITIYHDLNREPLFVVITIDGKRINPKNYEWKSENSIDYIILTFNYPLGDSDEAKIRML